MRRSLAPLAALFLFCAAGSAGAANGPVMGNDSHLPVPRFASLKTEGANGRRGPGENQPVQWVYQHVDMPLLITGESGSWRRVRDPDGAESWMHAQNLNTRRTALIRASHEVVMRNEPKDGARVVAYLAPGVVGALTGCDGSWRRMAVGGRVGWVNQGALWGSDTSCAASAG